MGAAKTGGNYASSLVAQQEATAHDCDQVVFLDVAEGKYVEELGGMNLYFVYADGHIVTPETGTILEGITRSAIIELAGKKGHQVEERKFSIDEWRDGVAGGEITEVFACGTAAVVTPVGTLQVGGRRGLRRRRRRPADDGDPAGPRRHPVRPRRRRVRVDAPGRLTRRPPATSYSLRAGVPRPGDAPARLPLCSDFAAQSSRRGASTSGRPTDCWR